MKFIRKSYRGLETRNQSYVDSNGRTITISGAMHLSTPEAWKSLIAYLVEAERNGASIHLEGVQPVPDVVLTEQEQKGITVISGLIKMGKSFAAITGLQHQTDAFLDAPKWEKHDLNLLEVVKGIDDKTVNLIAGFPVDSINISGKRAVNSLRNINLTRIAGFFIPMVRRLMSALIDSRNEYAINKAIETKGDVVLFWGAAHLSGMHKLLVKAGFKPAKTEWRVVLPNSYKAPTTVTENKLNLKEA